MAKIKLSASAAKSVHSRISNSAIKYTVPKYGFFEGHNSESQMMADFQRRAYELRKLLIEYKKLLERDVKSLDDACNSLIKADKKAAAKYTSASRKGGR